MKRWLFLISVLGAFGGFITLGSGAESLPSKPAQYVEDRAGILSPDTLTVLNTQLATFERETSNQVLVATFPSVPTDYVMEDFTQRTAESWGVGQHGTNNGVVFFIFPNDRKMRIEVGYGLEGVIPDATAKDILDNVVRPAFRTGDFNGGVLRGVEALLTAARGEYKGTGFTNADRERGGVNPICVIVFMGFILALMVLNHLTKRGGWAYDSRGYRRQGVWLLPAYMPESSSGRSSGSSSSSSFRGGGGSFGGGGASGSW